MGPGAHVVAVCQPCVQVLAAVAIMAKARNPAQPRSMTLMAGPVDAGNPTEVNTLALERPMTGLEQLIASVPAPTPAAPARLPRLRPARGLHVDERGSPHPLAHPAARAPAAGKIKKAKAIGDFYDEYFAMLDLPAEFYLETVRSCSGGATRARRAYLARRAGRAGGDPAHRAPHGEGERDDICSVGQTLAAHDLCTSIKPTQAPPHAGRRRPLRGVQRQALGKPDYPVLRNQVLASN